MNLLNNYEFLYFLTRYVFYTHSNKLSILLKPHTTIIIMKEGGEEELINLYTIPLYDAVCFAQSLALCRNSVTLNII